MTSGESTRPGDGPSTDGAATTEGTATVVDARGLRCPLPVIRLARAAAGLADGDLVTVWSTDPAAVHDVPAWARMRGHVVVRSTALDDPSLDLTEPVTAITVRLGG